MSSKWYWWNRMLWSSVADMTLIGMVTSPNETAPVHTGRGMTNLPGQAPRTPSLGSPPDGGMSSRPPYAVRTAHA
ncbi:hypothetical protein GCM10010431_11660 [Streptomyces kunmingensis]